MKCSVFIATSADNYIATEDGSVDWLDKAGKPGADMGDDADMGFASFMAQVDCLVMGRKTMEKVASFNLAPEQWPYGERPVIVPSSTLTEAPTNLPGQVEIFQGSIAELIAMLEERGFQHAYVDGGTLITAFLNLGLIDELHLTIAPVLLGSGRPLFGKLQRAIELENARAQAYANDFIQVRYQVRYPEAD